ncbi:peptidase M11 gametolysin [Vibrio albus]|uniref:Peptidase M11 gametolysin n=1 Tax=Vibrio albus TaxID=2200953 RepID=A0A2U3BD79_9VIBR|nr:Ig-like domain-containing protein [Vibrio albus]PWI34746.1 peptidase M11 gametolysin [Vibrio albus]
MFNVHTQPRFSLPGVVKYFICGLLFLTFSASAEVTLSTTGAQNTLVLMVNFQENPDEQPLTQVQASELVFGEVNQFYQENSYGQTWLTGQVAGWLNLPISNQICDFGAVQAAADDQAQAQGISVTSYDRVIYLMTKTSCISEGMATKDGVPTRTYINGVFTARVIAHELGHNFSLYHSHALDCGDQTISDTCTVMEYGDTYDVMGGSDIGYLNTFQKEQLGWLEGGYSSVITEVTQDGTYSIANYETQGFDQPLTIKVPRGINPDSGLMSYFYIEYRQAVGFDSFLADRSYTYFRDDVTDGVVIRIADEGDATSSYLLHLKTDSQYKDIYGRNDWYDPAMPVGGSYTDPLSGTTLNLVSAANGIAEVSVTLGSANTSAPDTTTPAEETPVTEPAPIAVNDVVVINSKTSVDIDVLANDSNLSASWLVAFSQPKWGTVEQLSDGTLRYIPGKKFRTSDSFSYTITNGTLSSTATVSISLEEAVVDNTDSTDSTKKVPPGKNK